MWPETSRWQAPRVRDFAWVADPQYRKSKVSWQGIVVRYLSLPGHERTAAAGLRIAVAALEYFSDRYGRYPYASFTIADAAAIASGVGIEYPQLALLSDDLHELAELTSRYETRLVHEIAHQWWYALVGNNEVDEAWLDEAVATYSTRRFLRRKYGQEPPIVR